MLSIHITVMHLPTKFCANSSIQFEVIDSFQNPRRRPPPSWTFKSCTFGTFRRVNSVVLELYIKFGSNICDSHWDQHTYAHLMTSRELTSGFDFWSGGHLRMAVVQFLSASLYFSKKALIDVVGRWLVVTRAHCGQTVHPRPIVTMEH